MSFNTWCLSMTRLETLPVERLSETRYRLLHMMAVYQESRMYGGRLGKKALSELEKCQVEVDRVDAEIARRSQHLTEVREMVRHEVDRLRSKEQEEDWLTLREAIGDSSLLASEPATYVTHLRLIYLQLLEGCLAKTVGGGAAGLMRDPRGTFERMRVVEESITAFKRELGDVERVNQAYNTAYGSTPTRSAEAMVGTLEKLVLTAPLSPGAVTALCELLTAVHVAYAESVQRVTGPAVAGGGPLVRPRGCLLGIMALGLLGCIALVALRSAVVLAVTLATSLCHISTW